LQYLIRGMNGDSSRKTICRTSGEWLINVSEGQNCKAWSSCVHTWCWLNNKENRPIRSPKNLSTGNGLVRRGRKKKSEWVSSSIQTMARYKTNGLKMKRGEEHSDVPLGGGSKKRLEEQMLFSSSMVDAKNSMGGEVN